MKKMEFGQRCSRRAVALAEIPIRPVPVTASAARQPGARTVTEWRVTWQRRGWAPKSKVFGSEQRARDKVGVMMADEPWRHYGSAAERKRGPEELAWNDGLFMPLREIADRRRQKWPPVLWARIECRQVTRTRWEAIEHIAVGPADEHNVYLAGLGPDGHGQPATCGTPIVLADAVDDAWISGLIPAGDIDIDVAF